MPAISYIDRLNAALAADDVTRATELADEGLRAGVKHPLLIRLVAEGMERRDDADGAIALLRRGLVLIPGEPSLLLKLAWLLSITGEPSQALRLFGEAAKTPLVAAEAHYGIGRTLSSNGDAALGRRHLVRALELQPDYVQARATLALLLSRIGESEAGRAEAKRVLSKDPTNAHARLALAVVDVGMCKFAEAERRTYDLLEEQWLGRGDRAAAVGVLADALNGQGRISEAYDAYAEANAEMRAIFKEGVSGPSEELFQRIDQLIDAFGRERRERWDGISLAHDELTAGATGHAFLVGFPRSGTTLLEQVLAAHGECVTLEEKPTLRKAEAEGLRHPKGLELLANLTPDQAARYRRDYWRIVNTYVDPRGKLFIDKMPINSASLPVVAKLFPEAKILFARRDPRDVVLSCFRRNFMVNPMTYAFTTLEGTARLYDSIMRLSELYRNVLPLSVHEVRYERLVADFEGTTRDLCAFLNLNWDKAMRDFAVLASTRTVSTPSALQVRRGLYREGEGQWRPYAVHLAPVMPILVPWVERYDYAVGSQ